MARDLEALPNLDLMLGAPAPNDPAAGTERYRPIEPGLDLAGTDVFARRPDARPAQQPPAPELLALGQAMQPVIERIQVTTLAGFRVLDARGNVIAGREETGLSLAHIPEVKAALDGQYRAVMRKRVSDEPPPPLYSVSRGTGIRVFTALPVIVSGRVGAVIYASRTPSNIIKHIYGDQKKFIMAALAVIGATLAIGLLFWRTITRPIHALVGHAGEVGRGRREFVPLRHHGTREIALLSQSFVDMAARLRERSDYISTFAAHVSHELKTPLTSIGGAAELMREEAGEGHGMSAEERNRFLGNIIGDTRRLTAMLNRLRELARAENASGEGRSCLNDSLPALRSAFPDLQILTSGDLDPPFAMSAENMTIVLSHLADNAAHHGARRFDLGVHQGAGTVCILVANDGSPVSERNQDKIFEPFFTTRREDGGTGMGLQIARALLKAGGATIELVPAQPRVTFRIVLPGDGRAAGE